MTSTTAGTEPVTQPAPGDLKVWYAPQIGGPTFEVAMPDLATASLALDTLERFSLFEFESRIKPDYADLGGISRYEEDGDGGYGWFDIDESDLDYELADERRRTRESTTAGASLPVVICQAVHPTRWQYAATSSPCEKCQLAATAAAGWHTEQVAAARTAAMSEVAALIDHAAETSGLDRAQVSVTEEWKHENASGGGSIHRTREDAVAAQAEHNERRPAFDEPPAPASVGIKHRYVTGWTPDPQDGGR